MSRPRACIVKREIALKALDDAFADRVKLEYDNLANGFMGSPNAKEAAKTTFRKGLSIHVDAFEFATSFINETFKE